MFDGTHIRPESTMMTTTTMATTTTNKTPVNPGRDEQHGRPIRAEDHGGPAGGLVDGNNVDDADEGIGLNWVRPNKAMSMMASAAS